jgi:molecular chaperone HscA
MAKIAINVSTGSLQQEEMIVGIDLGTTNSLIAAIHPQTGKPVVLKENDGSALVPSIIYFNQDGTPVVGEEAKSQLLLYPERTIFSVKRLMGKNYSEIKENENSFLYNIIDDQTDRMVKVQLGDKFYTPIELSSHVLSALKTRAEHILKTPVTKAVITVPAYFNDAQRQATRDAGKLAGLDVLRIINEPTAASLAYGIGSAEKNDGGIVAVYDLGGGTFDISILSISNGIFEVLSTHGDTYLGGDDIDKLLQNHLLSELKIDKDSILSDKMRLQSLRLFSEEIKKKLSDFEEYFSEWEGIPVKVTRNDFVSLIAPLIDRTIDCCKNAMKDAGLNAENIP